MLQTSYVIHLAYPVITTNSALSFIAFGLGMYKCSCTMGTGGPFPGGKARPGRDADHSPPSSAEVENE